MGVNVKCPKCGSERVQCSNERSKNGCLWWALFGWFYWIWLLFKWILGFIVLICWDWWMAIIKKSMGKGYVWQSKRLFSGKKRIYYCHDCNHNFKY